MKKISFLFLTFIAFSSFGQIHLIKSDFATTNDTVRISTVNPTTIDFTTTGANQNWDYSGLVATGQKLINFTGLSGVDLLTNAQFGNYASAKYKANYFLPATDLPIGMVGNLIPTIQIKDVYRYTRVSDTAVVIVGLSILTSLSNLPKHSDTLEINYKLPLDFGNQYTSHGYTNMNFNPIFDARFIQHRVRESDVDGYGIITTPYNTFHVLRVHHTIHEIDSLYINYSGFTQWIPLPVPVSHEYEWLAKDEKLPVLKIVTTETGGTETVTSITYRDALRYDLVASIVENELKVGVYPNPVSNLLTINSEKNIQKIAVYDMKGQLVQNLVIEPTNEYKLNVSGWQKGSYVLVATGKEGESSKTSFLVE